MSCRSMRSLKSQLRQFVVDNFLFGDSDGVLTDDESSFLDAGILDSTGALELVYHLEQTYGIQVLDEEFVPENLDSISRLAAFVERKRSGEIAC